MAGLVFSSQMDATLAWTRWQRRLHPFKYRERRVARRAEGIPREAAA